MNLLSCQYLVVGAGAASMAFIDTLLAELPSAKVILVDKYSAPGGHWVHAYPFVRLHQPSLLYGVASRQLEGNWLKCVLGKRTLPWNHRATKREILRYFRSFVDEKIASGQLVYYPECEYHFDRRKESEGDGAGVHRFSSLDGERQYDVRVSGKLVNGVLGECKIPSLCPPQFSVGDGITVLTPNELYDSYHLDKNISENPSRKREYIVLGCGKTAMDTVVFLMSTMKVKPDAISWVIPNDVWMMSRESASGPECYPRALLATGGDVKKACAELEARGVLVRLDEDVTPTRFRFPVIGKDELKLMRMVPNFVRRGRVTSIAVDEEGATKVSFVEDQEPWILPPSDDVDRVFLHCTSPGPFNGNAARESFVSDEEMCLNLLCAPPVSISHSILAKLEGGRQRGTLDLDFGRQLLRAGSNPNDGGEGGSDNDILRELIHTDSLQEDSPLSHYLSLSTLAVFLAIIDKDPKVGHGWMKKNRLSFYSIPGFQSGLVEDLAKLVADGPKLGLTKIQVNVMKLLHEKLQPLKGK